MLIEPVRELRAVCRHLRPGVILAFAPDELVRRTGGAERSVDGDCAYILWSETTENVYEVGTDTFVARNDQITAHSFPLEIRATG
jgi:hypothetical protein